MTRKVIHSASWVIGIIQSVAMIWLFIPWITNSPILTNPWTYVTWVGLCGVGFLLALRGKQGKAIKKILLVESSVLLSWLIITALIFVTTNSMP